jgi:hypothetical protein
MDEFEVSLLANAGEAAKQQINAIAYVLMRLAIIWPPISVG